MALYKTKKGLDLPITGVPEQRIEAGANVSSVAIVAADYIGMRPTMYVSEGDAVKRGQPLFEDKKTPGVIYTAPGAGTVQAVNRGERRALQTVIINLSGAEREDGAPNAESLDFEHFAGKPVPGLTKDDIRTLLLESGLWTAFRTRPFSKVPAPGAEPDAIFVTAMDTNPLAADPAVVLEGQQELFAQGMICVAKLCEGHTYLCRAPESNVPYDPNSGVHDAQFDGPHPAGTVGLHMHTLRPVSRERTAWHLNYQDVVAIGTLFTQGQLRVERVVALGGPVVKNPRLLRTRVGAFVDELVAGELEEGDNRVVSGSVWAGRKAMGGVLGYLGRYHNQITALREGTEREFLGWLAPGSNKFSVTRSFLSSFIRGRRFDFTTAMNGSPRAIVPFGLYERVMPMDLMATHLLRALSSRDIELSEALGCLELDEEDLALCSFVCTGKNDYGPLLREVLDTIEKEG